MPKTILLEDYHLTVIAPAGLRKAEYTAMVRTLHGKRFQARLHEAVREVFRRYSSLKKVQFSLDR
jgi:hypothetical protein